MKKINNEILAAYLSGECSAENRKKFEIWLKADPANQKEFDMLVKAINSSAKQNYKWDTDKLWLKIVKEAGISEKSKTKTIPFTRRIYMSPVWRIAAVFLLILSLPFLYTQVIQPYYQSLQMENIMVENGQQKKVQLPDGSVVMLDAGSSFSFSKEFAGNTREVFLEGEGFFKVNSNSEKPFVVYANNAIVKVLGTKFNVRAWQQNKRVKVAVAEGKVSLRNEKKSISHEVVLTKGQLSTLEENGTPSKPISIDIQKYIGWMNKEIIFNDAPLHEILFQVERWYNVKFELNDRAIAYEHLTLHIQKKPLNDILELISALTDLKYKRKGKIVYLSK